MEQADGHGGDAFPPAREAELLGGRGLYRYILHVSGHDPGEGVAHLVDVWAELGSLRADRNVAVDEVVTLSAYEAHHIAEKYLAVDALVAGIGVREMLSYVAEGEGSEESVAEGMNGHVGVAVAEESVGMGYLNTADPEVAVFHESVYVVALSDTEHGSCVVGLFGFWVVG